MRVPAGDGVEIFVREAGRGDPLLLIHGLGMSSALWWHQEPVLSPHYRLIAVDLRGFGHSSRPVAPGSYRVEVLAGDLLAVVERLAPGGCHVLGTSMGGFVAQAMAIARPALVRSLVLCHTAPRMSIPPDILEQRLAALADMPLEDYGALVADQALGPAATPALREWLIDMIAANDRQAYTAVLSEGLSGFDMSAALPGIDVPTLVVTGQHDRVLPPAGGRELAALIPGARFVEIPAAGHLGYAEQPGAFNDAVLSFLRDQGADGRSGAGA